MHDRRCAFGQLRVGEAPVTRCRSRPLVARAGRETAKNRVHIDIRVVDEGVVDPTERDRLIRAKVPALVALGASAVSEAHYDDLLDGVAMLRS